MSFGSRSLGKPTADEQKRMDAMKQTGCIISGFEGEIHHLLIGGIRAGHRYTICLNPWLHRGVAFGLFTPEYCEKAFGPSLAKGSKAFHAFHGSDQTLLNAQDGYLGWPRVVIPTKRRKSTSRCQRSSKTIPRGNRIV